MLESGHFELSRSPAAWMALVLDPARVLKAITADDVSICQRFLTGSAPLNQTNYIETLAITYGLLRRKDLQTVASDVLETMELLGYLVSSEFAEVGFDCLSAIEAVEAMPDEGPCDNREAERASQAIAYLWCAAFNGPRGYWHYLFRSLFGLLPAEKSFFRGLIGEQSDANRTKAYYLRALQLIEAGLHARMQPNAWMGMSRELPSFENLSGYIPSGAIAKFPGSVHIHVRRTVMETHEEQDFDVLMKAEVRLTYNGGKETIGYASAYVLEGESAKLSDILTIAEKYGGVMNRTLGAVFKNSDIRNQYPRVRRLLDTTEDAVKRVMVIERLYIKPEWRKRFLGHRLVWQLFGAAGEVDLVFGLAEIPYWGDINEESPDWLLGALFAGTIRLAYHCEDARSVYLINGVFGMDYETYVNKVNIGTWDRVPEGFSDGSM